MASSRKQYIDIARGLAIICIILGHLGNGTINRVVFTFHVPIFYLITGYFIEKKKPINIFIREKFKSLIIPYAITCFVIVILSVIKNELFPTADRISVLKRWIYASFYGAGDDYTKPFVIYQIGAIWFLLATFWGSVFLRSLLECRLVVRITFIGLWFAFCVLSRKMLFWFPWSIQASGPALLYMYIGYEARELAPILGKCSREIKLSITALSIWVWLDFIMHFKSFWLVHCDYGRGVTDIISSLFACGCIVLISWLISQKTETIARGLAYLGRYSLFMLCMHMIELDVFPWRRVIQMMTNEPTESQILVLMIIGKMIWSIGLTIVCMSIRFIRKLFGYKPKQA